MYTYLFMYIKYAYIHIYRYKFRYVSFPCNCIYFVPLFLALLVNRLLVCASNTTVES